MTGDVELFTIDPVAGGTLTATEVTMPGYNIFGFNGLATHPETGELWALLRREGLPGKTRVLATIDPLTGVATQVGVLPGRFRLRRDRVRSGSGDFRGDRHQAGR